MEFYTLDFYSRGMATNDRNPRAELTQDQWDEINRYAQSRRVRAEWLSLEHKYHGEFTLPAPRQEMDAATKANLFTNAANILRSIGSENLAVMDLHFAEPNTEASKQVLMGSDAPSATDDRHLTLVDSQNESDETWEDPVDWSECIERTTAGEESTLDLTAAERLQESIELREREIALRGGRVVFADAENPSAMTLRRRETLAWKQLQGSRQIS